MADISQFFKKLDNDLVLGEEGSVLVDEVIPGAPLVISFAFYMHNVVPGYDFYGRLKKLQQITGTQFNLVLVRDKKSLWYQTGIEGLGSNIADTVKGLKAIIDKIKPSSVITIGQSMGAYSAIHYGTLLGADKCIAFGPLSFIDAEMANEVNDKRWLPPFLEIAKLKPEGAVYDLHEFLKKQGKIPEIHLLYGGQQDDGETMNLDEYHARRIKINNSVILEKYSKSGHAIVKYLTDNKLIDNIVGRLVLDADLKEGMPDEQEEHITLEKRLSSAWSKWVIENLIRGFKREALQIYLQESIPDMTPQEIEKSLADIMTSPYMQVCQDLYEDTKKREWVLKTVDQHNREKNKYLKNFIKPILPNYQQFLQDYYFENTPGLFRGAVADWPAMGWTPENLKTKVGNPEIEVQTGRSKEAKYEEYGYKLKTQMKFHDFIDQILSVDSSNDMYLTANNAAATASKLAPMFNDLRNIGDGYMDMDKLNKQGFIWIGPKGTFTPAHHDLTNNIFIQLYGHKRFWLMPSTQVPYVYNGNHVYSEVDIRNPDYTKYPDMQNATIFQFDVGPGDFLFIPIGWWHAVESFSTSISFSTNAFAEQHNSYFTMYPKDGPRY